MNCKGRLHCDDDRVAFESLAQSACPLFGQQKTSKMQERSSMVLSMILVQQLLYVTCLGWRNQGLASHRQLKLRRSTCE